MAIGVPYESLQRMNPLQAGGYYPSDIRDSPPAPIRDFEAWSAARRLPGRPEEGMYFPSIAETVGRGPATMGPGAVVPVAPQVVGNPLPVAPTDYYPDIANNVGGGEYRGPAIPAPGTWVGPPAPGGGGELGPGIPAQGFDRNGPVSGVTSVDLPPAVSAPTGMPQQQRPFRAAAPMAGFPASSRYSSTRPEFIFTNPHAAAQAASNYQARLGFESAQDQGYRDYLHRLSETQGSNERWASQAESNRAAQAAQISAAQSEGAANRASNERIAGMTEAVRQHRVADAQWAQNEQAATIGDQTAAQLNGSKDPVANSKVSKSHVFLNPQTGKWESRFKHYERPVPPSSSTTGAPTMPAAPVAPPPAPVPVAPTEQAPTAAPATPVAPPGFWETVLGATTPALFPHLIAHGIQAARQ